MKIRIVDDTEVAAHMAKLLRLAIKGVDVQVISTELDFHRQLPSMIDTPPDLFIIDVSIAREPFGAPQVKSGRGECCIKLLGSDPVTSRIPVISLLNRHDLNGRLEGCSNPLSKLYRPTTSFTNIRDTVRNLLAPKYPEIQNVDPKSQRKHIFISYSHKDKRWLDDLLVHLTPYLRVRAFSAWSDKQIAAGSAWFDDINAAMSKASIAVLLVTPNFLASEFIVKHELSPILTRANSGGVKLLWIPVKASSYEKTPIRNYQSVINPSKPLAQMKANRDAAWVQIAKAIEDAVIEDGE